MKTLAVLPLVALVASCHIDQLVSDPGGPRPPPGVGLVFSTEPTSATAGEPITPPLQVTVRDSTGQPATSFDGWVTVALGANPGGATLSGTDDVRAAEGVATFPDLRVDKAGTGYTLTASADGLVADTTRSFDVAPGPATTLLFTVQPSDAMADSVIRPAVQVTAFDAYLNKATNFTGSVRVALGTDGSVLKNAELSGSTQVPAAAGVATFADLHIDQAGVGYTLTAAFESATASAESAPFDVTLAPGDLTVTTATTGSSPDPDGYTVTVDGGQTRAIDTNGDLTYTGLAAGSHQVALTNVAANCTVSGANPRTISVPAGGTATASFSVSCPTPTGSLTVTTSTTGPSLDPNGYTVTLDGGPSQPIGINASITFPNLAAGSHSVVLSDVAANCTVTGANPRTVSVTAGSTAQTTFTISCPTPPPTTGDVTVTTATTGTSPDPNGYTVTVDGGQTRAIAANGNVTYTGLAAGDHQVVLSDVAANCTVSGANPRTVSVTAGATAQTTFTISCPTPLPTTGDVTVTTATTGASPDPNGYTVTVDGGPSRSIGTSGSTTYTGLAAGDHDIALGDVAANCTVSGANPRTVSVTAGATAQTTFTISCPTPPPTTGDLTVTTTTTGTSPDPNGYTVTVDGGPSQAIGINASVTFPDLSAGSHSVALSGIAANCSLSGSNPRTVTVPSGSTDTTTFSVSCTTPTGNLTVTTTTTGLSLDLDGYTVTVDGGQARSIDANGTVTYTGLTAGSYSVQLSGVAVNCTVSGANPRTVSVPGGTTAQTTFTITCTALPPPPPPPAATRLIFTTQPSNALPLFTISPVRVAAADDQSNIVPSFSGSITLAIGRDASLLGNASLRGTTSVPTVNGVATFSNLSIDQPGIDYTLVARNSSLGSVESASFTILIP